MIAGWDPAPATGALLSQSAAWQRVPSAQRAGLQKGGPIGEDEGYTVTVRLGQSARLLPVPPAWLVWPFGGPCGGAAGSEAISDDLGRRRSRLFRAHATCRGSHLRRVRAAQARIDRAQRVPPRRGSTLVMLSLGRTETSTATGSTLRFGLRGSPIRAAS